MSFRALYARLGPRDLARRLGVTVATIEKWRRDGASARGQAWLRELGRRVRAADERRAEREREVERQRRSAAAKKAAATRKKRDAFQSKLPVPRDSELPPGKVIPRQRPRTAGVTGEDDVRFRRAGTRPYRTRRYRGEIFVIQVGKPLIQVDVAALARRCVDIFRQSGRQLGRVIMLFFRYFALNPNYKGYLRQKAGTWEDEWRSTETFDQTRAASLYEMTLYWLERQRQFAYSRLIWLEQVQVQSFDDTLSTAVIS